MTPISKEIFEKYQLRKTKRQKTDFINFMQSNYPDARVEASKSGFSRNIVIGDVANAKAVLTAHYDTCAVMPVPNFIMPKNVFLSLLYGVMLALPMIAAMFIMEGILFSLTDFAWWVPTVSFLIMLAFLLPMMFGKANKHTANDNTSGVIQLIEIMASLDDNERKEYAFVFFDNEEIGLIGSAMFRKMHKTEMKTKLLINFDCVSDGDNIMLVLNKKANMIYTNLLAETFYGTKNKNILIESSSGTYYPSDQAGFSVAIGVAALKKSKIGYYMNRIHTDKDTVFDETNIEAISLGMIKFLRKMR